MNLIQQVGFQILLERVPDVKFDLFPYLHRTFSDKQNSFHTNARSWCLLKCIRYYRLDKCKFHIPDFLKEVRLSKILSRNSRDSLILLENPRSFTKKSKSFYTGLLFSIILRREVAFRNRIKRT